MEESRNDSSTLVGLIFFLILFVCVVISTLASYEGLYPTLREYSALGAAIIALLLFVSNIVMKQNRQRGLGVGRPLMIFGVALIVSTLSNFNFFYSNFLGRDTAAASFATNYQSFNTNVEAAETLLGNDPQLSSALARRAEVRQELDNLRAQALDPLNPGLGPEAQKHISAIYAMLPGLTPKAREGRNDASLLTRWLAEFDELVVGRLNATAPAELRRYFELKQSIERAQEDLDRFNIELRKPGATAAKVEIEEQIRVMRDSSAELEVVVNELVTTQERWTLPREIDTESGKTGDIVRTLQTVLSGYGNTGVALIALCLSLFIDLVPILYAYALFSRPDEPLGGMEGRYGESDFIT